MFWLFLEALEPMIGEFRFSRMGIKIAETHKKSHRWQHRVAPTLATGNEANIVDLNIEDAREWFMDEMFAQKVYQVKAKRWLNITARFFIGFGKWVGTEWRTVYRESLARDKNLF